jgi:phosphate ABC transporter permease protein PstC
MNRLEKKDRLIRLALLVVAFSAVSILAIITVFMFQQGTPVMFKYGFLKFLAGSDWYPGDKSFGLWPMIVGSVSVTFGAMVIGVPFGLACAIVLTEFSSKRVRGVIKPVIELLAGIPSVVYGFMGVVILVPFIRETFGGPGLSVLAASIILGIMILPTIISISVDSIQALPPAYRAGSLALGATKWQVVAHVVLPAAVTGIVTGVILCIGRTVEETAVLYVTLGGSAAMPTSLFSGGRTLSLHLFYLAMETRAFEKSMATGAVLIIIVVIINTLTDWLASRYRARMTGGA